MCICYCSRSSAHQSIQGNYSVILNCPYYHFLSHIKGLINNWLISLSNLFLTILVYFSFQVHWPFCVSVCSVLLLQEVQYVGCLTNNRVLWLYLSHLLCFLLDAWNCFLFCISAFRAIHLCEFENGLIGEKYQIQDSRPVSLEEGIVYNQLHHWDSF